MRIARLPDTLRRTVARYLSATDLERLDAYASLGAARELATAARLYHRVPTTANDCRTRLRAVVAALPEQPTASDRLAIADCVARHTRDTLEPVLRNAGERALAARRKGPLAVPEFAFSFQLEPAGPRSMALLGAVDDAVGIWLGASPGQAHNLTTVAGGNGRGTLDQAVGLLLRLVAPRTARDGVSENVRGGVQEQARLLWALLALLGDRVTLAWENETIEPGDCVRALLRVVRAAVGDAAVVRFATATGTVVDFDD
jgi:hypothetical protein